MRRWAMEEQRVVLFTIGSMLLVCGVRMALVLSVRAHKENSKNIMERERRNRNKSGRNKRWGIGSIEDTRE